VAGPRELCRRFYFKILGDVYRLEEIKAHPKKSVTVMGTYGSLIRSCRTMSSLHLDLPPIFDTTSLQKLNR